MPPTVSALSTTITDAPLSATRHAAARPAGPAPSTTTSADADIGAGSGGPGPGGPAGVARGDAIACSKRRDPGQAGLEHRRALAVGGQQDADHGVVAVLLDGVDDALAIALGSLECHVLG